MLQFTEGPSPKPQTESNCSNSSDEKWSFVKLLSYDYHGPKLTKWCCQSTAVQLKRCIMTVVVNDMTVVVVRYWFSLVMLSWLRRRLQHLKSLVCPSCLSKQSVDCMQTSVKTGIRLTSFDDTMLTYFNTPHPHTHTRVFGVIRGRP